MKSKLLNLLAVSLTSSVLIAPAQRAFAHSIEPQTKINELQLLIHNNVESSQRIDSKKIQTNNKLQESKTETTALLPAVVTDENLNSSQPRLGEQMGKNTAIPVPEMNSHTQQTQVDTQIVGIFIAYVFLGYISVWLVYKKRRAQRTAILLQQIELLERIWKMESRR